MRIHVYQSQQAQQRAGYAYLASQFVPKETSSGVRFQEHLGGGQQPGQVQQYQTDVVAPVVMVHR